MTDRRCAYDDCQAGGVILEGAPFILGENTFSYHPGCADACRRAQDTAR